MPLELWPQVFHTGPEGKHPYIGVTRDDRRRCFNAGFPYVCVLGSFGNPIEAAKAVDKWLKVHRPGHQLNFPEEKAAQRYERVERRPIVDPDVTWELSWSDTEVYACVDGEWLPLETALGFSSKVIHVYGNPLDCRR